MNNWKLLKAEILHRKFNFALSLFALVAAAMLFVSSPTLMRGYSRQSREQLQAMLAATDSELSQMQSEANSRLAQLRMETDATLSDLRGETDNALSALQKQTGEELQAMQDEMAADLAEMEKETQAELAQMQTKAEQDLAELDKRTKRIMRDLGFNLRIVHKNTDMTRLFANFEAYPMPEQYVQLLADSPEITKIVHLVATLKKMIQLEGEPRLLVGFAPEATQSHIEKKAPMGFQIERGTVFLGYLAGQGREVGDTIELMNRTFEVAQILPSRGDRDNDILIAMHLQDAQEVLDMPQQISEIIALGCKCKTLDRVEEIREQLQIVLPDAKVTELNLQAIAREDQRKLVETHAAQAMADYKSNRDKILAQERAWRQKIIDQKQAGQERIVQQQQQHQQTILEREAQHQQGISDNERAHQEEMLAQLAASQAAVVNGEEEHRATVIALLATLTNVVTPLVVLVCAIWVGALAWINVRERRTEIGVLRALGKTSADVAALFLSKAILLGLAGGVFGCALGLILAQLLAAELFAVATDSFAPAWDFVILTLLGAPMIAALASYLPMLRAVTQDPAVVLMEN